MSPPASHTQQEDSDDDVIELPRSGEQTPLVRDESQTSVPSDPTPCAPPPPIMNTVPSAFVYDVPPKDKLQTFWTRTKYYVPVLQWLPQYDMRLLLGDVIAGLTLSCLLIPQGLSYATALCKLPAVHGLYAIAFPATTYAFFGTSRQLSMGPEATLSMLVGSAIAQTMHSDASELNPLALASLMTLFVGLFTFLLGLFRLGFLDSLMSRALLRGFITAVAIVVMVQQSITLLGLVERSEEAGINEASSTIDRAIFVAGNFHHAHSLTTIVSGIACGFLLGFRLLKHRFPNSARLQITPEVLLVVVLATWLTSIFRWEGLQILGDVQSGGVPWPSIPSMPKAKHVKDVAFMSALISILGFVESIVISKTYSSKHNYSVSPNRELIAMGVANIMGGLFQGIPAFGSVKINDRAGARTQLAGFIAGVIALLAIFFLLPYFYYLPKAVLSSIIFVAVLSLLAEAPEDIEFMWRIHAWRDFTLLCATFLATVAISLEAGTLLAVSLSLLLTVKQTSYPRITIMVWEGGWMWKFKPIRDAPEGMIEHVEDVLIVRVEEPLFFANTGQLKDRLRRLEQFGDMSVHPSEEPRLGAISNVIFDVEQMLEIDASAIQILIEIVEAYNARYVQVFFVKIHENARELFELSGLTEKVGPDHIFKRVSTAIDYIERHPQGYDTP
ncbi:sulfate transporter family-domain-containing protein [Jimgerdemannia flammicorona]|uniref:Sulfate transporter family-domain-containing protein n=2 Tax=Jimgerdemannia flammicorona TaxID=994334 RepID=A0A433QNE2_9FUNG|nr:sulfate transporter family-domain-containing protein [Jimgerdemannia flammicorona]